MRTVKERVLVAMSGGVDSSMAALLLHTQGYEVIGLTMKTWDYALAGREGKERGCCSLDAINDARELALQIGAPHYVTDIRTAFGEEVIDYFKEEYLAGRTPNPCVMCNTHIKWRILIEKANALSCKYVATGHYVRLRREGTRYVLSRAKDLAKDQSYALWGVSQEALSRTIFPMAQYTKPEIKQLAKAEGLHELAKKPESYEICFIPDGDYRKFLRAQLPELDKNVGEGAFVLKDGTEVGRHSGYPFYTIGQRRGLSLALGYPAYVVGIDKQRNEVVIGTKEDLLQNSMYVDGVNWVKCDGLRRPRPAQVQIRYNDKNGTPAQLIPAKEGVEVRFGTQASAIAPGQAAVFYEGDDLLGGGWIRG